MNELAMNLAAERVHDGYFEVFIVAQAAVADVLCKLLAVQDRFGIALELGANQVPHRNAGLSVLAGIGGLTVVNMMRFYL